MKPTPVESSMNPDVGYDSETETLEIGFNCGTVYQYFDLEPEAYEALMQAGSNGRHVLDNIEPFYAYDKVRQTRRRKLDVRVCDVTFGVRPCVNRAFGETATDAHFGRLLQCRL
jgi:hypothetical protein